MIRRTTVATLAMLGMMLFDSRSRGDEAASVAKEFFEKKIRPVLIEKCYECHSAEASKRGQLKGGLALDTRGSVLKGGESGPALVRGKPSESLLLKAIRHEADASKMPPNEKLSAAVIADFETWIAAGAVDPREGTAVTIKRGMSLEEARQFWSFIPPRSAMPLSVSRTDWPLDDIDRFVLAKLDEQKLSPLGDADARSLVRRLYFDLIGLPPSPAEVDEFVAAPNVEKAVDQLLASRHFGERWGRHWLDVARYADSNGRDRNVINYHAWRYRNYVIDSLNRDKPFDQFIREQIAGDLLPAESLSHRDELRTAVGFLSLGPKSFEEAKLEVFRMDVVDEQIELVSRAVLGLSVGCARCHDHKFDAIPTTDYYALAGIFRSTQPLYGYGPKGIKATAFHHTDLVAIGPDAERLGPDGLAYFAKLEVLNLEQNTLRSQRYGVVRRLSSAQLQLEKLNADKAMLESDIARMEAEIKEFDVKVKAAETAFQTAMDAAPPQPGWVMSARDRETPEDCRIHIRGETTNLGDVVPRGFLRVIDGNSPSTLTGSGRRELAEWLTHRNNPLTARVFVNRVWLHLFGRGLVTTPDDFGINGARPSHPELLDHLAVRLMDNGWSIKRLIRAIVLSRTYREKSGELNAVKTQLEADPDHVYLWRMRPRQIEVEVFRDAIKSVAGTLDREPPSPGKAFLDRRNPYRDAEYFTFNPPFLPPDIEHGQRSVYLPVVRGVLPEMFSLFDFASPDRSVAQREESTVPAQSLFLMNNPWLIEQSRATAKRLLKDEALLDDAARVDRLYQLAFARHPAIDESKRIRLYLDDSESSDTDSQPAPKLTPEQLREERWISLCQLIFGSAEFRTLR